MHKYLSVCSLLLGKSYVFRIHDSRQKFSSTTYMVGVSLWHHVIFLSPPSYLWLVSVPQNKMMDLTHSLDETANVFIFEPGSTTDALVL